MYRLPLALLVKGESYNSAYLEKGQHFNGQCGTPTAMVKGSHTNKHSLGTCYIHGSARPAHSACQLATRHPCCDTGPLISPWMGLRVEAKQSHIPGVGKETSNNHSECAHQFCTLKVLTWANTRL